MSPVSRRAAALAVLALAAAVAVGGCDTIERGAPSPTPVDFPGVAGQLGRVGVAVEDWRSGDAGCDDATLAPTAVSFSASGLGVATPIRMRIYIFGSDASWTKRSADVDACIAQWATDPATVEIVDVSPYVLAGQGPWPDAFKAAVRTAIVAAAGAGG